MFLCTYVDMFPQTNVLSDIKMNVSSQLDFAVEALRAAILSGEMKMGNGSMK